MKSDNVPDCIEAYIASQDRAVQPGLRKLRETIIKAAPGAEEAIRYRMPTFVLHGNLVHFAVFKNHIGFYPTPSAITAFREEISAYKNAKGSVQFPRDQPIPYDLVTRMVKFRVKECLEKTASKGK